MRAVAVSPAKVILFGEHFVVSGNTAIAMSLDLQTKVVVEPSSNGAIQIKSEDLGVEAVFLSDGTLLRAFGNNAEAILRPVFEAASFTLRRLNRIGEGLRITVRSNFPVGMGLGSSAATAVGTVSATARIFGYHLSKQDVFEAAYSLERIVHGHPSGVDQAAVTYGGLICYRNETVEARIDPKKPPLLVIGNTGIRRSTGEFVGKVTMLREKDPQEYRRIASQAQIISEKAADALRYGHAEALGELMNENQHFLELIGVSSPYLEKLISAARSAGALGAKLTGGGGGGCMIALVDETASKNVARQIEEAGGQVLPGTFVPRGVVTFIEEE